MRTSLPNAGALLVAAMIATSAVGAVTNTVVDVAAPAPNFQALWYASPAESQPGWGVNIVHQGDTLFATWFSYDGAGTMWLVMSNGAKVSGNLYRGTLYRTTGPAFNMMPFDPAGVNALEVGTATFDFIDESRGNFSYILYGVSGSKPIVRQVFGTQVSQCSAGSAPSATNFQDLWWTSPAGSESGWGVNLTHQGNILFATWFTYGAYGSDRWLVMPSMIRESTGGFKYSGDIYETAGSAFNVYDPSLFKYTPVGRATFEFGGASAGTFTYTLDGVTQSKTLTRQLFSTPVTVCQ